MIGFDIKQLLQQKLGGLGGGGGNNGGNAPVEVIKVNISIERVCITVSISKFRILPKTLSRSSMLTAVATVAMEVAAAGRMVVVTHLAATQVEVTQAVVTEAGVTDGIKYR